MKRLVVCCDGTWQSVENDFPTNVLKIAQAVTTSDMDGHAQMVFYDGGVGLERGIWKLLGGAFGTGLDEKIQAAYRFLCLNHEDGDEVFLFGFSRGAYTVRSLAGMIYKCGLVRRENVHRTPQAYALYRNRDLAPASPEARDFRRDMGREIAITALACWDTVGSRGLPETVPLISKWINRRYAFYNTTLNPRIKYAFHAVATDELRTPFNVTPMTRHEKAASNQVTQMWFPGEHTCVGGGMRETRGLSDNTLDWMIAQVAPLGLQIDRQRIEDGLDNDPATPFDNRPRSFYRLLGRTQRVFDRERDRISAALRERKRRCPDYHPPTFAGVDLLAGDSPTA